MFKRLYANILRDQPYGVAFLRRIVAGLSLRSNACPAKRPSLRACGAGVGFGGLIYQHVQTDICGYFERPTLRGCTLRRTMAGLSLCSNACPAKRPSLRACVAGVSFCGLICTALAIKGNIWLTIARLNSGSFRIFSIREYLDFYCSHPINRCNPFNLAQLSRTSVHK